MKTINLEAMAGDTVYRVWPTGKNGYSVATFVITHVDIDDYPNVVYFLAKTTSSWTSGKPRYSAIQADFGKTVFLTEEDARKEAEKRTKNLFEEEKK